MTEKIKFQNSKGLNLVGVLHTPEKKTEKAVIIAHGFTSNKDRKRHQQLADVLAKDGIAAFRIDFGGSGESDDREITIKAEIDDLLSTIKLLKGKGYKSLGVLGESLGGIVALKAYNSDINKAIVLWAPVTKALDKHEELTTEQEKQIKRLGHYIRRKDNKDFKIPKAYLDERTNLDRESVLGKIKIPVMIVHGTADEAIPIDNSKEAIKLLPEGSKLEIIDNWEHGDHKMDESMDIIIPKTVKWFKEHLSK